ncbi:MAG TPA: aldehyde dehydrogenase family protein [Polyangiaceae bacterium]|nr:aldehyde dehydrogenase family protein [Polyangiaceae bacterium]
MPPTPEADVDRALERLSARKDAWVKTSLDERKALLRSVIEGFGEVARAWVEGGCRLKGIAPGDPLAGEEWLAGPVTSLRNARMLLDALEQGGRPRLPKVERRPDGQAVARVFPADLRDRLLLGGFRAEVWLEPGAEPTQGRIYREKGTVGRVCLVLGAGNVSSIPPMDTLYKLFVEDEVVLLKMNPVNEHVGPRLERAFRRLVDEGFFAVVYGGAEVGSYCASHPLVDTLHVTGSDRTYDAIVWGHDEAERARRKRSGERRNERPFSAELGCVTPVLVVPGPWSDADLDFQAKHVASMVAQNGSFNCNAAKVLVTASNWDRRDAFLAKLERALAQTAPRKAYYPGAESRYQAFLDRYPRAKVLGARGEGIVPWTLLPGVPPKKGEYALTNEAFCGVLAETSLNTGNARDFLAEAVPFANESCWGTLSCTLLVDGKTSTQYAAELDRAVAGLRYGGIGVNAWPGAIYGLVSPTWGAYPGHPPEDIQSGAGVVHNAFLLDRPQKSVLYAPFRINPKPAWFADHKNLAALGERLFAFETSPSWGRFASVAAAGLKG